MATVAVSEVRIPIVDEATYSTSSSKNKPLIEKTQAIFKKYCCKNWWSCPLSIGVCFVISTAVGWGISRDFVQGLIWGAAMGIPLGLVSGLYVIMYPPPLRMKIE